MTASWNSSQFTSIVATGATVGGAGVSRSGGTDSDGRGALVADEGRGIGLGTGVGAAVSRGGASDEAFGALLTAAGVSFGTC